MKKRLFCLTLVGLFVLAFGGTATLSHRRSQASPRRALLNYTVKQMHKEAR